MRVRRRSREGPLAAGSPPLGMLTAEAPNFSPSVSERFGVVPRANGDPVSVSNRGRRGGREPLPRRGSVILVGYLAARLGGTINGRATDRLDRSHHHWRKRRMARRAVHEESDGVMNIVLGIIGAAVASWLFGLLGITFAGWIGYLIAGFIGACILIAIARAFSGGLQQRT